MKQKTKVAFIAFVCGSLFSTLISSIMHNHLSLGLAILLALLFETIIFIKAYSDE